MFNFHMKTNCIRYSFLFFFLFSINNLFAQQWLTNIKSANPTFKEIQQAFYNYWDGRTVEKGQGYNVFKRWEWFWQDRLLKDGSFPKSSITVSEWEKYQNVNRTIVETSKANGVNSANGNWASKGPFTSKGGYSGLGRVNCIAFHPSDPNIFWIGTPAGGVWKTLDGGQTWSTSTDDFPVLGVSDIAVNPTNPNILYAATGDGDVSGSLSSLNSTGLGDTKSIGVLKSFDGGNSWFYTGLNWSVSSEKLIRRLIIDPVNPNHLVAAASDGIWVTFDAGNSWIKSLGGYFIDTEFKPFQSSIVYAAQCLTDYAKIYRSTDGGVTWTISTSLPDNVLRLNLEVSASSPNLVEVLSANDSGGLEGLWFSNNSGLTFSKYFNADCNTNLLNESPLGNGNKCDGQGSYDLAFAINPRNSNELFIGGINTWKSTDAGSSWNLKNIWSAVNYPNTNVQEVHADKHFIAYHPLLQNTVYECNDGGLYKSSDGGTTWTDLSNGLVISQLYRIGVNQNFAGNVLSGLQDNGSKEIVSGNWYDRTGGDGMECIIDYTNGNIMYAAYVNGQIYKTVDGGSKWFVVVGAIEKEIGVNEAGRWVTPYVMHPTNPSILLVGKSQVYKTTDGGMTWSQLGTISGIDSKISVITYAPSDPNVIYVASEKQIFKTVNGGITWFLIGESTLRVTYLAVDPANPSRMWFSNSGYEDGDKVWFTSDGGATWVNQSNSLPNVPVNCITYEKGSNDGLYIGTDLGVFYKDATMSGWVRFSNGLPNVVVTELEIAYSEGKLYAATFGRGLWQSDLYSPPYVPVISPSNDTSICAGQNIILSAPLGFSSYLWSNGAQTQTIAVTSSGSYTVQVVDANGQVSAWAMPVTITVESALQKPIITKSLSNSNCVGQTISLRSTNASNYSWFLNDTLISNSNVQIYTPIKSGIYRVQVYSQNKACSSLSDTIDMKLSGPINYGLLELDSISVCGDSVVLEAASGYSSYLWNTGATTQKITAKSGGRYYVRASCGTDVYNSSYLTTNFTRQPKPYMSIPNAPQYNFTNEMSVIFSLNLNKSNVGRNIIMQKGLDASFQFSIDSYPFLKFSYPGIGKPGGLIGQITMNSGAWVGVVKTKDSVFLYINNVLIDKAYSPNPIPVTTSPITVGKGSDLEYFSGTIDQLSFWNRSLTKAEITKFQTCMNGKEQGCVAFYNFDQNNAYTIPDFSAYSNTASQYANQGSYGSTPYLMCSADVLTDSVYVSFVKAEITNNDTAICKGSSILLIARDFSANKSICTLTELPANLNNGLLAAYSFCGNANDLSANGYNAISINALATADRFGNINRAFNFNGTSSKIQVPNNVISTSVNELTINTWVYLRQNADGSSKYIYYNGTAENAIAFDNNSLSYNVKLSNGVWYSAGINAQSYYNKWILISAQYKKGNYVRLYVNGSLVSSTSLPNLSLVNASQSSYLGASYYSNTNGNQIIDDLLIYNRLLSETEIGSFVKSNDKYYWSTGDTTASILVKPNITTTYYLNVTDGLSSCLDSVKITLLQADTSVQVLDSPFLCKNIGTVRLKAALNSEYQWLRNGLIIQGANSQIVNIQNPGEYRVIVKNQYGCQDTSRKIIVSQYPQPIVNFSINDSTQCLVANQFQFTNQSTVSSGNLSYEWSMGDGVFKNTNNISYYYNTPGIYQVKLKATSDKGCIDSIVKYVEVYTMPSGRIKEPIDPIICSGSSITLSINGGLNYTYQWFLNGAVIAGADKSDITASKPGVYSVELVNAEGCNSKSENVVTISVIEKPIVDFSYDKYCVGIPLNFYNKSISNQSGVVTNSWVWGDGSSSQLNNPTKTYLQPGSYNVKLKLSPDKCPQLADSIVKLITIVQPLKSESYLPVNGINNIPVNLSARSFGTQYSWSPVTGLSNSKIVNPILNPTKEQLYFIAIENPSGCITVDTQLVRFFYKIEIFVPKAFSPNGDGQNDKLFPITVGIKQFKYLRVYNRWGNLVFNTDNPFDSWNGMLNGVPQPIETYIWVAEGVGIDGKIVKRGGNVLLIR